MALETVDYGTSFTIEFAVSSQQYPGVKVFVPGEVLSSACQIRATHLLISVTQYGKSKYISYLLGPIGAFILGPLFGSLSPNYNSFSLPWDKIEKVEHLVQEQKIVIVGVPEGQKRPWLFSFKCTQPQRLLENLAAFVPIEGVETPARVLARELPDEFVISKIKAKLGSLADWVRKRGFSPHQGIMTYLSEECGAGPEKISNTLHHLFLTDSDVRNTIMKHKSEWGSVGDKFASNLVQELARLKYTGAKDFCRDVLSSLLADVQSIYPKIKIASIILGVITAVLILSTFIVTDSAWQVLGWLIAIITGLCAVIPMIDYGIKYLALRRIEKQIGY